METTKQKRITLATVKSFIRKNDGRIHINVKSRFNGMIDGLEFNNDGFSKAEKTEWNQEYTLGIAGAWFVGSSRDRFSDFDDGKYSGIRVSNACGSFILATQK